MLQIEIVAIDSVLPDPANTRVHNERNLTVIKASLARFGQQKPIVVDQKNIIRAGNGTWAAAKALGWTEITIHRTTLTGSDASAFAIADNRTSDLSEFDPESLIAQLRTIADDLNTTADEFGFNPEELKDFHDILNTKMAGGSMDPEMVDVVTPVETKGCVESGDLWMLGDHRLMCGDSTKPESFIRLLGGAKASMMATDPPYAVNYKGGNTPITTLHLDRMDKKKNKDWSSVYQEVSFDDVSDFIDSLFSSTLPSLNDNSPIYIWHAHVQQPALWKAFDKHGLLLHQYIIWVKPMATFGRSFFQYRHEQCLFGWKKGFKPFTDGSTASAEHTTVWEFDWEGKAHCMDSNHPTQKPIKIFETPMAIHTKPGDIVLEPFSGSGSQIIAAERMNRKCYAMEISPTFVYAGIARWESLTGKKAILESTGKTYDEMSEIRSTQANAT